LTINKVRAPIDTVLDDTPHDILLFVCSHDARAKSQVEKTIDPMHLTSRKENSDRHPETRHFSDYKIGIPRVLSPCCSQSRTDNHDDYDYYF